MTLWASVWLPQDSGGSEVPSPQRPGHSQPIRPLTEAVRPGADDKRHTNPALWIVNVKMINSPCSIALSVLSLPPAAQLCGDQHVVDSLLGQQLLVRPLLDHYPPLQDGDAVCILDGGQTVRHDNARPALAGLVQRLLHHLKRGQSDHSENQGASHSGRTSRLCLWS